MKYSELVEVYTRLEKTSKRLEKTKIISESIKPAAKNDLPKIILLLQGKIFPPWDKRKLGVASGIVLKAIGLATGIRNDDIQKRWRKTGDLGTVAEELVGSKKQSTLFSEELDLDRVFNNLKKLCKTEGAGSVDRKVKLIAQLLTSSTPKEAMYIIRTVLEDLRVGVGEGSIRDAIVWAYFGEKLGIGYDEEKNKLILPDDERDEYKAHIEAVAESYDKTSDFGKIAQIIKEKGLSGLDKLEIEVGKPIKVMLVQKARDPEEAFGKVGKPAAFEYKYDGFRLQIHKKKEKVWLFTRRLEDVTRQFPDVVESVIKQVTAETVILDSETVGISKKTGRYMPFQAISQRIKRKYDIDKMQKDLPVEVNVFDVLYYDGKSTLKEEFHTRRDILNKLIRPLRGKIVLAEQLITSEIPDADRFYKEALKKGNEGLIAKSLGSIYKPGSRVGFCVKIKPVMKSLELVIVAAEWGEGKRRGWLTSFTLACKDNEGRLLEIGKVSTGVKELSSAGTSYEDMTKLLKDNILAEKGRTVTVKPEVVIEVNYEEIQKSPTYNSGFALRFPRFIRLRDDRSTDDIDSLDAVRELYEAQRHRNS